MTFVAYLFAFALAFAATGLAAESAAGLTDDWGFATA